MNTLGSVLRYIGWVLESLALPAFVVVLVAGAAAASAGAIAARPAPAKLWKAHYWFVLTHALFFVAAIGAGVHWMVNPGNAMGASTASLVTIYAVLIGSLASCVFWVWRMRGLRWLAAGLMLMAEACVLAALFVAGMSVSGDWL